MLAKPNLSKHAEKHVPTRLHKILLSSPPASPPIPPRTLRTMPGSLIPKRSCFSSFICFFPWTIVIVRCDKMGRGRIELIKSHNATITWECRCWAPSIVIFMEIVLYQDLSQVLSVSHGKLTVGHWCGHAKIAGPFMGCGAAERVAADKQAVGTIKDHLRW